MTFQPEKKTDPTHLTRKPSWSKGATCDSSACI